MNPCEDCIAWPICKPKILHILDNISALNPSPVGILHASLYRECSIFRSASDLSNEVPYRVAITKEVIKYARGKPYHSMR